MRGPKFDRMSTFRNRYYLQVVYKCMSTRLRRYSGIGHEYKKFNRNAILSQMECMSKVIIGNYFRCDYN